MSELGAVRAKMKCHATETSKHSPTYVQHKVRLGAVCGKEGDNASFTKYTPAGECWMNIEDGAPAVDFFEAGQEYYVTFTKAPRA